MVHRAAFWTYRAGTKVRTADGRQVGAVSAVRRDAVLVSGLDGECSWVGSGDVLDYDGVCLTVSSKTLVSSAEMALNVLRSGDPLIPTGILRSFTPQSFDA